MNLKFTGSENNLIIFVKYPDPGKVKTRLASEIGYSDAARIYKNIAEEVISRCSVSENYSTSVCYHPLQSAKKIKDWLNKYKTDFSPQSGDDLGARMYNAFYDSFSAGYKKTIIIGSDCPGIGKERIENAFNHLEESDVVIGPSIDGGYYLIGLKKSIDKIFIDMEWSTENVLCETIERLKKFRIDYYLLEYLNDIDTLDDLKMDESVRKMYSIK